MFIYLISITAVISVSVERASLFSLKRIFLLILCQCQGAAATAADSGVVGRELPSGRAGCKLFNTLKNMFSCQRAIKLHQMINGVSLLSEQSPDINGALEKEITDEWIYWKGKLEKHTLPLDISDSSQERMRGKLLSYFCCCKHGGSQKRKQMNGTWKLKFPVFLPALPCAQDDAIPAGSTTGSVGSPLRCISLSHHLPCTQADRGLDSEKANKAKI